MSAGLSASQTMNPPSASTRPTNCRIVTLGCHFEYSSYARRVSASACWPPIPGRTRHSKTYFITYISFVLCSRPNGFAPLDNWRCQQLICWRAKRLVQSEFGIHESDGAPNEKEGRADARSTWLPSMHDAR